MLVVGNPQHQNPYSYVGNNPINGLDSTGWCDERISACPVDPADVGGQEGIVAGPAEAPGAPSAPNAGGSRGTGDSSSSGGAPSTPAAPTGGGGADIGFSSSELSGGFSSSDVGLGAGDLDTGGLDSFGGDGLSGGGIDSGGGLGGSGSLGNFGMASSLGGLGSIQSPSAQSVPGSGSSIPSAGLASAYGGSVPEAGLYVATAVVGLETARAGLLALGQSAIARTALGLTARQAIVAAVVGSAAGALTVLGGLYVAGFAIENGIRLYNQKTGSDIRTPNGILGREFFPVIR